MAHESQTNETIPTLPVTPGSFDAFVGTHLPVLLRVAGSLCRNSHDAEDLMQDTLIRAFKGLDGFDPTTAAKVSGHLDACRRCGLAAEDYRRLKLALAETSARMPSEPLQRLQALAADLASGEISPT